MLNTKSHVVVCNESKELEHVYDSKYNVLSTEPVEIEGRILNQTVYITKDLAEERKQFKPSDFYLENLIAVGAVSGLKPVSLDGDVLSEVDKVSSQIEKIEIGE